MPEKYTVKITQQAQEQIREIVSYIRFTLQAPETAMKMLDTLQEEIASLDQFPNRVPLTEEEPWRSQGIHKFPVKNYLIYFWVDEETKKVEQISSVKVTEYFLAHQQDILGIVDGSYLEEYHDYDKGVAFINAATVSTTYALLSRCSLAADAHFDPEEFTPVFDFNTPQTVFALGSAVSEISEKVLRSIEVTIKKYEREKLSERSQENERTDLHTQRGLLDSQSEPVPAGEQAPGQVREDAESIPSGVSPGAVEQPDPVGAAVPPSAGDRRDGEQAVGADDAHTDAVGGGDGSSESQRPHEMAGADEQPESPGRGSDSDGADLRLTDEPPITTLKAIESEGRQATKKEQEILSRYVGWGGLADAFDDSKSGWASEYQELKNALTPAEYEAARASTLNAHYTSPTVIRAIYEAVGNMGFQTGNILEPSMGVGNFFGMLPDQMQNSRLYGVELDPITGRIAKQLYPKANITVAGFETTDHRDFFDLAVGNVPFGQYKVNDRYHLLLRNASQAGQWNYRHSRHSGSGDVFPKERLDSSDHCVPVQSHGTAHDCGLDSERASRYEGNVEKHLNSSSGVNMAPEPFLYTLI